MAYDHTKNELPIHPSSSSQSRGTPTPGVAPAVWKQDVHNHLRPSEKNLGVVDAHPAASNKHTHDKEMAGRVLDDAAALTHLGKNRGGQAKQHPTNEDGDALLHSTPTTWGHRHRGNDPLAGK